MVWLCVPVRFVCEAAERILIKFILIEGTPLCFNTQNKMVYSVETQQQHKIISTLVWLHVSVLSRPSSRWFRKD